MLESLNEEFGWESGRTIELMSLRDDAEDETVSIWSSQVTDIRDRNSGSDDCWRAVTGDDDTVVDKDDSSWCVGDSELLVDIGAVWRWRVWGRLTTTSCRRRAGSQRVLFHGRRLRLGSGSSRYNVNRFQYWDSTTSYSIFRAEKNEYLHDGSRVSDLRQNDRSDVWPLAGQNLTPDMHESRDPMIFKFSTWPVRNFSKANCRKINLHILTKLITKIESHARNTGVAFVRLRYFVISLAVFAENNTLSAK